MTEVHMVFPLKTVLKVVLVILALMIPISLVSGDDEMVLFEHRSLVRPGEYDTFRFTTHSDYPYFGVGWCHDLSPSDDGEFYLCLLDEAAYANYSNAQPYRSAWEDSWVYTGGYPKCPRISYSISGFTDELAAGQYVLVIDNTIGNKTLGISLKVACGSSSEEIESFFDSLMYSYASLPSFFILALSTGVILMVLCIQRKNKPSD
ncbi:MAG: hypothetical protein ACFFDI_15645 [Promethearchaeota archaeon]